MAMDANRQMTLRGMMLVVAMAAVTLSIPRCTQSVLDQLSDTTVYAPGYSEDKFRRILPGMTEDDVLRLMGSPLEDESQSGSIVWYYGPPDLKIPPNSMAPGAGI